MTIRFIISLLATVIIFASCRSKSADDIVAESVKVAAKGDCRQAITIIDEAITLNPNHKGALFNRGLCFEELKDSKAAISDFDKLLKIDPRNIAALYNIGNCKYDLNLFQDALVYYNKALLEKGYNDTDSSKKSQIIITMVPINPTKDSIFDVPLYEIIYQRGLAYYQLNDFRRCYNDFYNCMMHNHYPKDCQYMIALCDIGSGNKKKGCEELDKLIALGDTIALKKKQEVCN